MDVNKVKTSLDFLSKLIDENERISLPVFATKLAKASKNNPEDYTIGMMATVVEKMADNNKLFITRAEVKNLYSKLYSRNSHFAELFSDELGAAKVEVKPKTAGSEVEAELSTSSIYEQVADPILSNALNVAFGNKTTTYSTTAAKRATDICLKSLESLRPSVTVAAGNEHFVICTATFETPKGHTSCYVPVEIEKNQACIPSVFVGNAGPEDFSKDAVKKYIVANAGKGLEVKADAVLNAVQSAKLGNSEVSSVDLALTKLNASKEHQGDFFAGSIVGQKLEPVRDDFETKLPKFQDQETEAFAAQLEKPAGVAEFKFGKEKVASRTARIRNKLLSLGAENIQISVCDVKEAGIVCAVKANGIAFKVPVNMVKDEVPTVIIANGTLRDFSASTLSELTKENIDYKTAAVASPLYNVKASELVEIVRTAMTEGNLSKAEDALNVLSQSEDERAYKTAFDIYTQGLAGKKEAAESHCSMVVKGSHSTHMLCGHTGLPLHKVYQDNNGNCKPIYRKGMDESYEGASFLTNKIFF